MEGFKKVLESPKFLKLWASQILSQVTINVMNFLFLTRLFTLTGSSIATSLLWVAYALPAIFIGPIGAVSVDLVNRREMLMITNFLQALTVFSYVLFHNQTVFILYGIVSAYSLLNQFYNPAEAAYLPSTVSKEDLSHANSLFFMTQQGSLVFGFAVAGLIQSLIGFNGSLILCSIFLFLAFVSTAFLPDVKPTRSVETNFENVLRTLFTSILEGYDFIRSNKNILFPLLLMLGIQVGLAITVVNIPAISARILGIPVNLAGVSIVVPAGIGAMLGSIFVSKKLKKGVRKKVVIEYGLAVVSFSLFALALIIPFAPLVIKAVVAPILIALAGFGFVGINIPVVTYLQEVTPLWLRGRVFGNLSFLVTIITILPVLFSGVITEVFGVRTMFLLISLTMMLVLVYLKRRGQYLIETTFSKNNG
jgi:MFS family permease